jgi:hypothetical protein
VFGLPAAVHDLYGLQFEAPDEKLSGKGKAPPAADSNVASPTAARQWLLPDEPVADQLGQPRPDRTLVRARVLACMPTVPFYYYYYYYFI